MDLVRMGTGYHTKARSSSFGKQKLKNRDKALEF